MSGHSAEKDRPWANCQSVQPHPPHDWDWRQVSGPQVTFHYHCPGVANVTIEPAERRLIPSAEKGQAVKRCVECGRPARGYSSYCQPCHSDAFEGGADIG